MPLRSYDPVLARWNHIDPVTHHSLSPYNSFDNNPVFYSDPSGGNSWGSGDVVVGSDHNSGASNWSGGWTDYSEWGVSSGHHFGGYEDAGSGIYWGDSNSFQNNGLNASDFGYFSNDIVSAMASLGINLESDFLKGTELLDAVTVTYGNESSYRAGADNAFKQIYQIEMQFMNNLRNAVRDGLYGVNSGVGALSTASVLKGRFHMSNEIWHINKTGKRLSDRWRWRWDKRLKTPMAKQWRLDQLDKVKGVRNVASKLTKVGGALLVADIAMSGEIKTSHAINAFMLGISTTGVGSIVAGVWFIADFGTMGVNYLLNGEAKGLSDIIDENTGSIELYDGLY